MIVAESISKKYGKYLALDNVSLSVKKGEVFALLGPNGAGKTTFVKSLLGLVHLSEGKLLLRGKEVSDAESRVGVGYLPEKFSFHNYYTVYGCVEFFGKMNGLKGSELRDKTLEALDKVGVAEISTKKLDSISKGQLQRTGIATLLVSDNQLIILDEPFSGLDPLAIKELKDIIAKLASDSERTVFINSHILSEMEKICDSMAILDKGKVLVSGKMGELLSGASLEDYFYKLVKDV
ncbi:ABC transporter ATP-binding protein [Halobacteriovorax sp.]|uniref:ABC transporter ATP-binding protein n=1 Tax=Halobacteriovorax sp. TaxID=2020862 RepID=UPI00356367BB